MDLLSFLEIGSFAKISERPDLVPAERGVYAVLSPNETKPKFLEVGTGGHFKGKNPNVPLSVLEKNWVLNAPAIYIGQAGGGTSKATLRKRLLAFAQFGMGKRVGHWGGRLIWQIPDAIDLRILVLPTDGCAREKKRELLQEFKREYDCLPFANLRN